MTKNPEVMITSDTIFDMIKTIADTPGKNDKVALLKQNLECPLFEVIMVAAHDPFVTYGIKKRPAVPKHDGGMFDNDTFGILDDLFARTLSGNAAIEAVANEMERLSEKSSELFWNIVTKDLKAGFGDSSLNKAKKKLIQTFPYMRCSLSSKVDLASWCWERGVISQEKADGMFANVDNEEGGVVNISSRQGSLFPSDKFKNIADAMQKYMTKGMQYHGEFVVQRDGLLCERQDGNGVLNSVLKGGDFAEDEEPAYLIWDAIPLDKVVPKGKYEVGYAKRLNAISADIISSDLMIAGTIPINLIETKIVHSLEEATAHYTGHLAAGHEGTVIKHPDMIWKDGTSKDQVKLKLEVDVDLKVIAIVPGKPGSRIDGRAGALTCITEDGLLKVDVTVKNEAMRDHVDANPDEWIDSIIVVRSNQLLKPSKSNEIHSLFLPRMVEAEYRTDKSVADTLEQVDDQFKSAIKGK